MTRKQYIRSCYESFSNGRVDETTLDCMLMNADAFVDDDEDDGDADADS